MKWLAAGTKGRLILAALLVLLLVIVTYAIADRRRDRQPALSADARDELAMSERLRMFDAQERFAADFAHRRTWNEIAGAEPYVVARVPQSSRFVGILRGESALVVLDDDMRQVTRLQAPEAPVALAVGDDGAIFVAGELAAGGSRYRWQNDELVAAGTLTLEDIRAVRGIAAGARGWIYCAEERGGTLVALRLTPEGVTPSRAKSESPDLRIAERREMGTCRGPIRLVRVGDRLIANCLLDHRLSIHRLEPSGVPSGEPPIVIQHDGPIWSFDAIATPSGLSIAAGGVEDHPLDRTIGAFGYIDSFVFLYRIAGGAPVREAAINVAELGVITPKAIALSENPLAVTVTGYGSDKMLALSFEGGATKPPVVRVRPFVPGTSSVAAKDDRLVFANPLLDAWIVAKGDALPLVVPISQSIEPRSESHAETKLGEALFFTTLMAPFNSAEGPLSRFTCETCHYEGYVDGRTHHTGRDDVHAVTKPLLGLFNNRPHFSRALDPDLTAVAFNEFRVAGAKSGHDPSFDIAASDAPWLASLGANAATFSPETLRRALMRFLIAFQHRPHPAVIGRSTFSEIERRGAALFRDHCETCHEARVASDQPMSRVPFDRWERLVLAREGPIVWGKDVYAQTGVLPYVHEKGARVPSLRRLYKKHPYFTNGSANSLTDVLARARFLPSGFLHDAPAPLGGGSDDQTTADENHLDDLSRRALLGFLQLL